MKTNYVKTKIACFGLITTMLAGSISTGVYAASTKGKDAAAEYALYLEADEVTASYPADFKTKAADGRVWTDKSVKVIPSPNDNEFEVTLQAMSQEYVKAAGGDKEYGPPADVMLVLDVTGSMDRSIGDTSVKRIDGMIDATNKAIDVIMKANPKNRIGITVFSSIGKTPVEMYVLPMKSYWIEDSYRYANGQTTTAGEAVTTGGTFDGVGKYISKSGTTGIKVSNNLLEITSVDPDGTIHTVASSAAGNTGTTNGSTNTQYGVFQGCKNMVDTISNTALTPAKSAEDKNKYPYLLILTDGEANLGNPDNAFVDFDGTGGVGGDSQKTSSASASKELSASLLLTAAYNKDKVTEAYRAYNGISGADIETTVFTIGLSLNNSGKDWEALNPVAATKSGAAIGETIINKIITDRGVDTYDKYLTTDPSKKYIYPTSSSLLPGNHAVDGEGYFAYSATNMQKLLNAFIDLAALVEINSKEHINPITKTSSGERAKVVFTDIIGDGMLLDGTPVMEGITGNGTTTGNKTTYTFSGKSSTAEYDSSTKTMTWTLDAEDLECIYIEKPEEESDMSVRYASKTPVPTKLTYKVKLDTSGSPLSLMGPYIESKDSTNVAKAEFIPTGDNSYYYDTTGTAPFLAKTSSTSPCLAVVAKGTNYTGTYENVASPAWDGNKIVTKLGNNGKETVLATVEKEADKSSARSGDILTYSVKVTNKTTKELTNVQVADVLPTELDTPTDISDSGSYTSGTRTIAWNVPSIAAGTSKTLTYKAKVNSTITGTITNTAKITSLNYDGNTVDYPDGKQPKKDNPVDFNTAGIAEITIKKDDSVWGSPSGKTFTIRSGGTTLPLSETGTGTGIFSNDNVTPGTYHIFDGEVDTGNIVTITAGNKGTGTVDYYTLTLNKDGGVGTVTGAGVYLKGTSATIDATLNSGYNFTRWQDDATSPKTTTTKNATITMDRAVSLKAITTMRAGTPKITLKKDDSSWKGREVKLKLKSGGGTPISLPDNNDGTYGGTTKIPEGNYVIVVDGKDTKLEINITDGASPTKTLEYYSLELAGDDGISGLDGKGVYLKGTEVDIKSLIKDGYNFKKWINLDTNSDYKTDKEFKITINKKLRLKAVTEKKADASGKSDSTPLVEKVLNAPNQQAVNQKAPKTYDPNGTWMYLCIIIMIGGVGLTGVSYAKLNNSRNSRKRR